MRFLIAGLVVLVIAAATVIVVPFVLAATPRGTDRDRGAERSRSASSPAPTPSSASTADTIRVAVVGDSLSAGSSGFLGNGLDAGSWMTYAQGGRVEYAGGWAHAGATPEEMAEAVRPLGKVDVLVILAGTNAVRVGVSFQQEQSAYDQIVRTIAPRRVIVSSIPPYVPNPTGGIRYNRMLREYVQSQGWDWFDAWRFARDGNAWKPGFSVDGVHPGSIGGYRALGRTLRWEILAEAG
ncbi:SGNH/GDSL hydrolase family protein [Curtobacterium sp. AB451]|uniref:SGNH/GDSL hydrolase family protein n=1 Tax=Curtobacterium sp. AB451 TaxID=3422306 RepID=UPI003D32F2C6